MDLHKIARVTRLNKLSKGRMLLIAAAVTWSTLSCSIDNCTAAAVANAMARGESAFTSTMDKMRLGGIPYRNSAGQVVISGSMSDRDYLLTGCGTQAQIAYDIARASEPAITMDMLEIADELGPSMEGLEYSVKTARSIKSKIERKTDTAIRQGKLPKSDVEYVQETGDLIRYTQIVPHDRMAAMTSKPIALLKAKGYVLEKVDNKYLNPNGRYKAIHLDIANAQGVHFEMQIHSRQTLAANRATHAMYEEWRRPETPAERKEQLYRDIRSIYAAVPQPKGIMAVKNYSRI